MKKTNFDILALLDKTSEAEAATLQDTHAVWLKFVFTDDQPNANKQGIRQDEFEGIIKTGVHKPIKKAWGEDIAPGHEDAIPIGTVANLDQDGNQIIGLASIWESEFPTEAASIRSAYAEKKPLNISWELYYADSEFDEEGIEWLKGVSTRGATIVGIPAYDGRTPILAVASKWSTKYINELPDSAFLYIESGGTKDEDGKTIPRNLRHFLYKDAEGNVDLPHLRNALSSIPQSNLPNDVKSRVSKKAENLLEKQKEGESSMELEQALKELEQAQKDKAKLEDEKKVLATNLTETKASLEELLALKDEVEQLRQYKETVEAERVRNAKVKDRLAKFGEAGVEMTEEQFMSEADRWLGLDDEAFSFVLTQLVNSKPAPGGEAGASLTGGDDNKPKKSADLVKEFLQKRKEK